MSEAATVVGEWIASERESRDWTKILGQLRTVFEPFKDRPGVVYILNRRG
jgi:hypothetical protein